MTSEKVIGECKFCGEDVGAEVIVVECGLPADKHGDTDGVFCDKECLLKFFSHGTAAEYPKRRREVSIDEMPDGKQVGRVTEYEDGITAEFTIDEWSYAQSFSDRCRHFLSVAAGRKFGFLYAKEFAAKDSEKKQYPKITEMRTVVKLPKAKRVKVDEDGLPL